MNIGKGRWSSKYVCDKCEKEFRKWLKEKPIIRPENIIDRFPIWGESEDK